MKVLAIRLVKTSKPATTAEHGLILLGIGLAVALVVLQVGPQLGRFIVGVISRLVGG